LIETPNYLPSKWLEKSITSSLKQLAKKSVQININSKFSISSDILTRDLSFWTNSDSEVYSPHSFQDNYLHLVRYANWHAIEGSPKVDAYTQPHSQDGYGVNRLLNSWQVEHTVEGLSFAWLKKTQTVYFPKSFRLLRINFFQGQSPKSKRRLSYSVVAENGCVIIRRSWWKRKIKFTLPYFTPSNLDPNSTDHRVLTVAATGYEFS